MAPCRRGVQPSPAGPKLTLKLLLDTNVLTRLCYPGNERNRPLTEWLDRLLELSEPVVPVYIPEIADYEVRRGLLHLALRSGNPTIASLLRLDRLAKTLQYIPLNTQTLRRAAGLWAQSRHSGQPTAHPEALDCDVILAAQALEVSGVVVTENIRHLSRFVSSYRWQEVPLRF